jgi:hypothetical protein
MAFFKFSVLTAVTLKLVDIDWIFPLLFLWRVRTVQFVVCLLFVCCVFLCVFIHSV